MGGLRPDRHGSTWHNVDTEALIRVNFKPSGDEYARPRGGIAVRINNKVIDLVIQVE